MADAQLPNQGPGGGGNSAANPLGLSGDQVAAAASLQKQYPTPAAFAKKLDTLNGGKPMAAKFNGKVIPGKSIGDQWTYLYGKSRPKYPPAVTLGDFEESFIVGYLIPNDLGQDIAAVATGTGKVTAEAAKAATTALNPFSSVLGFLQGLTSAALWTRVAKVVIGGALLLIGAAKLTGIDKQVAVLGKAVAKAPLL
jgi:hypothetical protein